MSKSIIRSTIMSKEIDQINISKEIDDTSLSTASRLNLKFILLLTYPFLLNFSGRPVMCLLICDKLVKFHHKKRPKLSRCTDYKVCNTYELRVWMVMLGSCVS